jgi:hypothetical protein
LKVRQPLEEVRAGGSVLPENVPKTG